MHLRHLKIDAVTPGHVHSQGEDHAEAEPIDRWRWILSGTAVVALAALVTGSVVAASAAAPANTKAPSISGSPIVGTELTGDHGT